MVLVAEPNSNPSLTTYLIEEKNTLDDLMNTLDHMPLPANEEEYKVDQQHAEDSLKLVHAKQVLLERFLANQILEQEYFNVALKKLQQSTLMHDGKEWQTKLNEVNYALRQTEQSIERIRTNLTQLKQYETQLNAYLRRLQNFVEEYRSQKIVQAKQTDIQMLEQKKQALFEKNNTLQHLN